MAEAGGNPQHVVLLCGERDADPFAEPRARAAQVNGDVVDFAGDDAHKLSLRLLDLIVQPAQNALGRSRVIVLHEVDIEAGRVLENSTVVALEEEATRIAEDFRFQQDDFGQRGRRRLQNTFSSSTLIKYWP